MRRILKVTHFQKEVDQSDTLDVLKFSLECVGVRIFFSIFSMYPIFQKAIKNKKNSNIGTPNIMSLDIFAMTLETNYLSPNINDTTILNEFAKVGSIRCLVLRKISNFV